MRKMFSAILCAVLLAGMLTACGGNGDNGGNDAADNSGGTTTASEVPEQLDLTVYMPIFNETPPETTLIGEKWTEMMESYLGTKLNIEWQEVAYADYTQKMSVYVAAGDWADVFTFTNDVSQLLELGQTGMLLCIDDYQDYAPNTYKYLAEGNNRKNVESADGKLYAMPALGVLPYEGASQSCFAVRLDAFEAHGIDLPKTVDDLYNAAKKFKELYPDSYPVSCGTGILTQFYSIYNTSNKIYYNGEEYTFGPLDGKLQGAVEYLAKLYAEGLLDPEYATQTSEMIFEKALNDKAFIAPFLWALEITDNINAASDTVEWAEIALPTGENGDTPWISGPDREGNRLGHNSPIAINAETEYPELVVKMLDYQLSDEMIELATWGVEGESFTVLEDGSKTYIDEIKNAENPMSVMAEYGLYASMSCRPGICFMPDSKEGYFEIFPKMPSWNQEEITNVNSWEFFYELNNSGTNVVSPEEPKLNFTEDENAQISETMTAVYTFVDENIARFIAGERPMSEWDAFVEEISDYGDYQAVLDMYNQKLADYNAQ